MPEELLSREAFEVQELYRLAKRLRAGNPIRQIALQCLHNEPLTDEDVGQLLKAIIYPTGFRREEQELAVTLLGYLTLNDQERRRAWKFLHRTLTAKGWDDFFPLYLTRTGVASALTALLAVLDFHTGLEQWIFDFPETFLSHGLVWALPMLLISSALDDRPLNRLRAIALRTCARQGWIEALRATTGALFDGAGLKQTLGCQEVREAAEESLPLLLAALGQEHYGKVSAETMACLCKALYHENDALVMHILEALEKAGDGQAVAPVERMVKRGRTPELRAAAERILPILQERQQQENAPKMLLRASSAPAETPDVLLRPAMHTEETEPETLLRASAEAK